MQERRWLMSACMPVMACITWAIFTSNTWSCLARSGPSPEFRGVAKATGDEPLYPEGEPSFLAMRERRLKLCPGLCPERRFQGVSLQDVLRLARGWDGTPSMRSSGKKRPRSGDLLGDSDLLGECVFEPRPGTPAGAETLRRCSEVLLVGTEPIVRGLSSKRPSEGV